jgi:hypothetical protein
MLRTFIAAVIIVTSAIFPFDVGSQSQGAVSRSIEAPLVTNCNTTPCRGKNEWAGGTLGISSEIYVRRHRCDTGCNFIEVGVWGKLSSDGSYLGVMTQSQNGTNTWFMWKKYSPGGGLQNYYIRQVQNYDEFTYIDFEVSWPGMLSGPQYVCLQGSSISYCNFNTGVNTRVWDRIQIGSRLGSQAGGAATVYNYHAKANQWRLGDNGQFYYQGSDGYPVNDAADWYADAWYQQPSQYPGTGGDWIGSCICP